MGLLQSIAARFFRSGKRNSSSSKLSSPELNSPDPRHELGRKGEAIAAKALRRSGYKVLYQNYRGPHGGEVDIVCRHRDTLVFVEVKTRRSEAYGTPAEAVTKAKQGLIVRGAFAWLRLLGNPPILFRFDIVEVLYEGSSPEPTIQIIENAFPLPERYHPS